MPTRLSALAQFLPHENVDPRLGPKKFLRRRDGFAIGESNAVRPRSRKISASQFHLELVLSQLPSLAVFSNSECNLTTVV